MTLVEEYKTYRKIGVRLNQRIIKKYINRDILQTAGKLLDIVKGATFVFENEDESSVLMDFALNERINGRKNIIGICLEKNEWKNETEKRILENLLSSHTSLFKIVSISEEENTLILKDLLNKKESITLVDINISKTTLPEMLLFIRIVPFSDEIHMTSGIGFGFAGNLEEYLFRRYKKLMKKVASDDESIKRFVSFFMLNRTDGVDFRYRAAGTRLH